MAEGGIQSGLQDVEQENIEEQNNEISALLSIYPESIEVFTTPDGNDRQEYTLQVKVHVHPGCESVSIETWITSEYDISETEKAIASMPVVNRPLLERSESGMRWHSSFPVKHLTPISLRICLPYGYPAHDEPIFTLSCTWLTQAQLSSLCKHLDCIWSEYRGMPMVHTWIEWLRDNSLEYLAITDKVMFIPQTMDGEDDILDQRAITSGHSLQEGIMEMIGFDLDRESTLFYNLPQDCGVCFDNKPGRDFQRLSNCGHHFCGECMKEYCTMHVTDGTVHQLMCPDPECKTGLPPAVIKDVLGEEEYQRWERLLLQRALDTMTDIVWCPRCNNVVMKDNTDDAVTRCNTCFYTFCSTCNDTWHVGKCKSSAEKLEEIQKKLEAKLGYSVNEEDIGKYEVSEEMKRFFSKMRELKESEAVLRKTTHRCPSCRAPIVKISGCNKVTCRCGASMCWLCGKRIQGYDHFQQGKCETFTVDGEEDIDRIRNRIANVRPEPEGAFYAGNLLRDPVGRMRILTCPNCKQRSMKNDQNNHIRCWACQKNLCFMCKSVIKGPLTGHFGPGKPCQQHTPPPT